MAVTLQPKLPEGAEAARYVLAALRQGPATAQELTQRCRIEGTRMAGYLQALEQRGAVDRAERVGADPAYGLAQPEPLVLGVDLGGTKIHVALADLGGTVLSEELVATDRRGGRHVVEQIGALTDAIIRRTRTDGVRPLLAAIGCPGVIDGPTGRIDLSGNIPEFEKFNVVEELRARLGCPVVIENDVNLGAIGERWHGTCRGLSDFAFVALGTGIGMGVVAGGRLVRGARGAAGEVAFLPLGTDPFDPASYPLGALESAIGSAGIVRHYQKHGGSGATTVKEIFEKLSEGEEAAIRTLDHVARLLAQALLAVGAVMDPEIIVLGGGIGSRAELFERVSALLSTVPVAFRVEPSALGTRAVVIGALSHAVQSIWQPAESAGERSVPAWP